MDLNPLLDLPTGVHNAPEEHVGIDGIAQDNEMARGRFGLEPDHHADLQQRPCLIGAYGDCDIALRQRGEVFAVIR